MDKKDRKVLKKAYQKKALEEKLRDPDLNEVMKDYYSIKLGEFDWQLNTDVLNEMLSEEDEIEHKISTCIWGHLEWKRKKDPRAFQGEEVELMKLSSALRMIYHTHYFENRVGMGDLEKVFLHNRSETELDQLASAYDLLGFQPMEKFFDQARIAQDESTLVELNKQYDQFEEALKQHKIKFIRDNLDKFELKE